MRWIIRIVLSLVIIAAVLFAVGFLLPREVQVARSATIEASPQTIYPLINDLRTHQEWSPWLAQAEDVTLAYEGPDEGEGQTLRWASEDPRVGSGSQTITETVENESVTTALDFGENGTGVALLSLEPAGEATEVTWTLDADVGPNPVGRWFGLFLDGMVGDDYERGLAMLGELAVAREAEAAAAEDARAAEAATAQGAPEPAAASATDADVTVIEPAAEPDVEVVEPDEAAADPAANPDVEVVAPREADADPAATATPGEDAPETTPAQ